MSEQEKNNAIATEGTVTESKKDPWYVRLYRHPVIKKVLKIVGVVGATVGAGFGGYELGVHTALKGMKWQNLDTIEGPAKIEEATEDSVE